MYCLYMLTGKTGLATSIKDIPDEIWYLTQDMLLQNFKS